MQTDAFGRLFDIDAPKTVRCTVCGGTGERLSSVWQGEGIAYHNYQCRADCPAGGAIVEHDDGDERRVGPVFGDCDLAVRLATCDHPEVAIKNHSRGASVRKFADLLETLLEEHPIYRLHVRDPAGKILGCWCRRVDEGEPACHGDILAARAYQLHDRMVSGGGQLCERGDHWLVHYRQWRECVWCGTSGQTLSGDRAIDRTGAYLWPRDDDDDETHHVSAVSDEVNKSDEPNKPDRADKPDTTGSHSPVKEGSNDGNAGFEGDNPAAHKQDRAAVASHHAPDERGQRGGPR